MLDEFEGEARYGLRRELDLDHILAESDLFAPDPAVDDETVGARLFDPDVDIRDSERNREQLVLRYGRSAEHFASRVDRLDEVAAMDVPPAVCVQLPAAIVVDEDSAEKWAIESVLPSRGRAPRNERGRGIRGPCGRVSVFPVDLRTVQRRGAFRQFPLDA